MSSFADHHIDPDELSAYVANKASREQADRIKRHVETCAPCKESLMAGLLQLMVSLRQGDVRSVPADNRRSDRVKSGETGYLQSISPLSFDRPSVRITDVSEGGIGLFAGCKLPPGTIVQICTSGADALGEVMSCVPAEGNVFRIGIRIESSTRLSGTGRAGLSRKSAKSRAADADCDLIIG